MSKKKRKRKNLAKRLLLATLGIVGATLLGVYFGYAHYFKTHYQFHTYIGSTDVSKETPQEVITHTSDLVSSYLLSITDRNGTKFLLRGPDFDYSYVPNGEEEQILASQNAFFWPASLSGSFNYDLDISISYNQDKVKQNLKNLACFSDDTYIKPPVDAQLSITDTGYEVTPEEQGNTLIFDNVYTLVLQAIDEQQTSIVLTDDCYQTPKITTSSDQIKALTNQLDHYLNATVTYEIENANEEISAKEIMSFLNINDDQTITINEAAVARFVQHLASTYNTYADVRDFTTAQGDVIQIGGGDYGWVIAKAKEEAQLLEDLQGGQPVVREPIYEQTARDIWPNDIGNTYLEIDYTNQHMWFFKEGSLIVESDIVSGNINRGNGSPDGVFSIGYKQHNATLVGEDYESTVNYFLPFAYNVGFHDATWRSSFGGEIYKKSGSHGCINLPLDIAETLYKEVDVNTPVVAYYRDPVTLSSENSRITNAFSYVDPDAEKQTETE